MNVNYIHVYLDKTTARLFKKALKTTKMSISGFVREAIREKIERMGLVE